MASVDVLSFPRPRSHEIGVVKKTEASNSTAHKRVDSTEQQQVAGGRQTDFTNEKALKRLQRGWFAFQKKHLRKCCWKQKGTTKTTRRKGRQWCWRNLGSVPKVREKENKKDERLKWSILEVHLLTNRNSRKRMEWENKGNYWEIMHRKCPRTEEQIPSLKGPSKYIHRDQTQAYIKACKSKISKYLGYKHKTKISQRHNHSPQTKQ